MKNLVEKPFKNENDLRKYMNNLRRLELINTDGMRRNFHYKLTKKCRDYLRNMHYNNLKYLLITRISRSPGGLIEYNFNKLIYLLDKSSVWPMSNTLIHNPKAGIDLS